ncbi:single-stranded DNA-binding protein [Phaeocystidibacter luteus]|uniref:Single-stranded DNA-binding protein n=1 Tax=Phaeocystidibacter luteus TaxID=911197 RepID=A0A6N6RLH9_9FLAO|nr:single-stranded DNA-binding protein [Phaeocystidibacter luteus]KAB2814427.1 single-stranded DNA-binding protein [Phaeocystidibacter luteus]
MNSLTNRVSLIGATGKDPEVKIFDNGQKKVSIRLATHEYYKNKDGERVEKTEWHQVSFRGAQAEFAENYIKTGQKIAIEGKLTSRSYTDKDGVVRYFTEVVAHEVVLLSHKKEMSED